MQKTTWGVGEAKVRKVTEEELLHATQDLTSGAGTTTKPRRPRAAAAKEVKEQDAPSEALSEAPKPKEDSVSLLSRLLSRSGSGEPIDSNPSASLEAGTFTALSGSDDFFSYLRQSSDGVDKPYDAMDFGPPPGLGDAAVIANPNTDDPPDGDDNTLEQEAGRGRKRGGGKGGGEAVGRGSKRQKKQSPAE